MNSSSKITTDADIKRIRIAEEEEKLSQLTKGLLDEQSKKASKKGEKRCRDERRMEINRLRAKQIRRRKKEMEEDMQKQIIQLTLENNKLRTQLKVQETEIALLRSQQMNMNLFNEQKQTYQQSLYPQQLQILGGNQLDMLSSNLGTPNTLQNNPAFTQTALGTIPNTQSTHQVFLPSITHSSLVAQNGNPSTMQKRDLNFLGTTALDNQHLSSISSIKFDKQDDVDQQSLAKILTSSSSHVKQSLLERLQSDGNIDKGQIQ